MDAFDCSNKSGFMHKQNRYGGWGQPIEFTLEVCGALGYMDTKTKSL